MAPSIIINKIPRDDPVPDRPISFPPLENLHLEMMEVKKKLKPGLPLAPVKKTGPTKPLPSPLDVEADESTTDVGGTTSSEEIEFEESEPEVRSKKKKDKAAASVDATATEDDEMMAELGDSESVVASVGVVEEADEADEADEDEDAGLTPEQREAKEREEYLWRFRILRKQWKDKEIPSYNAHSDLGMMKEDYDRTVKELMLEDNIESYRTYLMFGFIATEFIATQWIGVDLSGFTLSQSHMMHRYERLLVELGAKNAESSLFQGLPVEIRLIGLVLISAAIFYIGKIITAKYGSTFGDLFKGFMGQPPDAKMASASADAPAAAGDKPKRQMRGPKVNIDDFR